MKTKLVIFGITGDLSRRKLLPALKEIVGSGEFENLSIVGVSRRDANVAELVETATNSEVLTDLTTIFTMDLARAEDYVRLRHYLDLQDDEQALIYLSVPPSAAADIVDFLGRAGLNTKNVKLLFEKPFGFDLTSAQDFVERTGRYYDEAQIYRIDHYMAKEVAAEVIRLRSNAESSEHQWGNESVVSVDIIATEEIGIEDRATFYEETGALRDFIQGHLMQLLSLVLMDLKGPFTIIDIASRRFKALEQLNVANPADAKRAQYEGYQEEVLNPGSQTETFASVQLTSNDARWLGVPLRLTTGKNLDQKRSAITVRYHDGTEDTFEEGKIVAKDAKLPDAYERVLVEAIRGRKYIFTTSPEVLRSWEIVTPIQENWQMDTTPLKLYEPGASVRSILDK
ncbi:MAG: Glucose-6-phosphate 1-dehydrogenase [Candidatus Saccharibacteria bacterium]|nr:Glucose-6-phosphate 1-dehydrogenase [Candidatus Saccharibacteria bacterium]